MSGNARELRGYSKMGPVVVLVVLSLGSMGCHRIGLVPAGQRMGTQGLDNVNQAYPSGPPWCYPDTARWVEFQQERLRQQMGPEVSLIRDEDLCHRVSAVLDSSFFETSRGQSVLVFRVPVKHSRKVGPGAYVVYAPPLLAGEWASTLHLNEDLRLYRGVFLR